MGVRLFLYGRCILCCAIAAFAFLCLSTVGPILCILNMSCRFARVLTCLLFLHASGAVRFLDMPRELVMDVNKGCVRVQCRQAGDILFCFFSGHFQL